MPSQDDLTHLVEYSRVQPSQLSWVRSSSNTIQHFSSLPLQFSLVLEAAERTITQHFTATEQEPTDEFIHTFIIHQRFYEAQV